jgi:uroporphyrinogen decarboxylase
MTPRERVAAALDHQEPDRVPIGLGGSAQHLTENRYLALRDHFGLSEDSPRKLVGFYSTPDYNPLLDALGTDIRYVHIRPMPSFVMNNMRGEFQEFTDEWGLHHRQAGGYYVLSGAPLADITIDQIEDYAWPDPFDPVRVAGLKEEIEHLYHQTDYALALHRPVYGNSWEMIKLLVGMENALIMTKLNPDLFVALMKKINQVLNGFYAAMLDIVGPYVQIVEIADDLGTNIGPMISPVLYRTVIKPLHIETNLLIKEKAPQAKIMLHCDGAIREFIPDIIEAGFEILNPIEGHLVGMDPVSLKRDFGEHLTFMGGVNVKDTLANGTPEEVRQEVRLRMAQMGVGGGYILGASHNIGNDIPLENILAYFDAGHTYGQYPLDLSPLEEIA